MSRIARENPDLTEDELHAVMLHASVPYLKEGEPRYRYECRSCGDEMWLNQHDHNERESNRLNGSGFTIPKCGACWA